MVKGSAFAKYVIRLPHERAVAHIFKCLSDSSGGDNLAWQLWQEVHGARKFKPNEIRGAIEEMVRFLNAPRTKGET